MIVKKFKIHNIPAVIYGEESDKLYIFIHGQMGYKEEAESFAKIAVTKGFQVLGIDLPGHGTRKDEIENFDPWHCIPELRYVMKYAKETWKEVCVRANSIGAWFGMLAFKESEPKKWLLVSPIVDMKKLIEDIMISAKITPEDLQTKETIVTENGTKIEKKYYDFACQNSDIKMRNPIYVLYADGDVMTSNDCMEEFAVRNNCKLYTMHNGEHWFHTSEQLEVLDKWTEESI